VVKIVVAFPSGEESSQQMVSWRIAVVEGLISKPVCKRVDTEGGLLHSEHSHYTSVYQPAHPVTPKTCNTTRQNKTHDQGDFGIMLVLPNDNRIFFKISNIDKSNVLGIWLEYQPSDVSIQQAFMDRVWVPVSIGVAVMIAMVFTPDPDGILDRAASSCRQPDPQRKAGGVGSMRP
jgi:hypothetical protein